MMIIRVMALFLLAYVRWSVLPNMIYIPSVNESENVSVKGVASSGPQGASDIIELWVITY